MDCSRLNGLFFVFVSAVGVPSEAFRIFVNPVSRQ